LLEELKTALLLLLLLLQDLVDLLLELGNLGLELAAQVLLDGLLVSLDSLDVTLVVLQLSEHVQLLNAALSLLDADLLDQHLLDLLGARLPVLADLVWLLWQDNNLLLLLLLLVLLQQVTAVDNSGPLLLEGLQAGLLLLLLLLDGLLDQWEHTLVSDQTLLQAEDAVLQLLHLTLNLLQTTEWNLLLLLLAAEDDRVDDLLLALEDTSRWALSEHEWGRGTTDVLAVLDVDKLVVLLGALWQDLSVELDLAVLLASWGSPHVLWLDHALGQVLGKARPADWEDANPITDLRLVGGRDGEVALDLLTTWVGVADSVELNLDLLLLLLLLLLKALHCKYG